MDGTVALFDAATGKLLHTLGGHVRPVRDLAFTPGGQAAGCGAARRRRAAGGLLSPPPSTRGHVPHHQAPPEGSCGAAAACFAHADASLRPCSLARLPASLSACPPRSPASRQADSKQVITACDDMNAHLYDAEHAELIEAFSGKRQGPPGRQRHPCRGRALHGSGRVLHGSGGTLPRAATVNARAAAALARLLHFLGRGQASGQDSCPRPRAARCWLQGMSRGCSA